MIGQCSVYALPFGMGLEEKALSPFTSGEAKPLGGRSLGDPASCLPRLSWLRLR